MNAKPVNPALQGVLGAYMIGTVFELILFGANVVAAGQYFRHSRWATDKRNQLAVIALGLISLLETCCVFWTVWDVVILHFGDVFFCKVNHLSIGFGPALASAMCLIVQSFYANRIYVLSKKRRIIPAAVLLLAVVQFGFGIGVSYMNIHTGSFTGLKVFTWGVEIWRFSAVLADLIITVSLIYYLRSAKLNTDFEETKSMLDKVIASTLENNSVTGVCATLSAILFVARSDSWNLIFGLPLGKLYFCSMLASLNNRRRLAEEVRMRNENLSLQLGVSQMLSPRALATPVVAVPVPSWRNHSNEGSLDTVKVDPEKQDNATRFGFLHP